MCSRVTSLVVVLLIPTSVCLSSTQDRRNFPRSRIVWAVIVHIFWVNLHNTIVWVASTVRKELCKKDSPGQVDTFPFRIQLNAEKPIIFNGDEMDNWSAVAGFRFFWQQIQKKHKWCKERKGRGGCCCGGGGRSCCCSC